MGGYTGFVFSGCFCTRALFFFLGTGFLTTYDSSLLVGQISFDSFLIPRQAFWDLDRRLYELLAWVCFANWYFSLRLSQLAALDVSFKRVHKKEASRLLVFPGSGL